MNRKTTQNDRLASTEPPRSRLPRYLTRREGHYYFKRKIPQDVRHGFAFKGGQVWKSLGTTLFEKAKVMLAVEVAEFDLLVNKLRREAARKHPEVDKDYRSATGEAGRGEDDEPPSPAQQSNASEPRPRTPRTDKTRLREDASAHQPVSLANARRKEVVGFRDSLG